MLYNQSDTVVFSSIKNLILSCNDVILDSYISFLIMKELNLRRVGIAS